MGNVPAPTWKEAPPALPTASVYEPATTLIEAVPLLSAVKVAVRVRPEPLMAERVPPETTTSPVVPFHKKELPGSSEKLKVIVAVWPAIKAAELLVMASVGARVS